LAKSVVSGILLAVLLVSIVSSTFAVLPVKASGAIYIKADGSIEPPTAPISRTGNLYVLIGNIDRYPDGIFVQRSNIVIDGSGCTLWGFGSGSGFNLCLVQNVTVQNARIENFNTGICINASSSITVSEIDVMNCSARDIFDFWAGIMLVDSTNINVDGCSMTGNDEGGISLNNSANNYIVNNKIENNSWTGISLWEANNSSIRKNRIRNNWGGIEVDGSNNDISENNVEHNDVHGIEIGSDNNSVCGNSIVGSEFDGVWMASSNSIVRGNKIENNGWYGIFLAEASENGLYDNNVTGNGYGGIEIKNASDNLIVNNRIENHRMNGVDIIDAPNNEIRGNNIANNGWPYGTIFGSAGIHVQRSSNITIRENNIVNNTQYGVCLVAGSETNRIYHNSFVNNEQHAYSERSGVWDYGYPSGGNYWSDFSGVDQKSGPNQDQSGSDGIVDTQYVIDANNRDRYPLMKPWTPIPIDTTPPTPPVVTDDGKYTSSAGMLHATWSSLDPESGIAEYQYAIGTSPGDTNVVGWTSIGTGTEVIRTGLDLIIGSTYYFSVKAKNGQGLWSAVGTSDGITATVFFDLSAGWDAKELFVPLYYRSPEVPGDVVFGVHNRRDMWYLVEVYTKQANQDWQRTYPWDLPYLGPYGEKAFSVTPAADLQIKIVVWNDLNDQTLRALWTLDFAVRALLGVSISPQITDLNQFLVTLGTFYNEFAAIAGYVSTKQFKNAVMELGKLLVTSTTAQSVLVDLLKFAGVKVTVATIISKALSLSLDYALNAIVWLPLLKNTNKEPWSEEVIFAARNTGSLLPSNIRATESLRLEAGPYYVGQTIVAQFTIQNEGTVPITLNTLTVGGRGPNGNYDVRDFTLNRNVTLNQGSSYDYTGDLNLIENGDYHFFIAYQTSDGDWETSVPTKTGITNVADIYVDLAPKTQVRAELGSPGELRIYDSEGKITGSVNGEEENEIPYSVYFEDIVTILAPTDYYRFEVAGTGNGSYSLIVTNVTEQANVTYVASNIPISAELAHQYTIDWAAVSEGQEGATTLTFRATDLNRDGTVNIVDVSAVARAFRCQPGDRKWNAMADLNRDGQINIVDVNKVARDFGKKS
jgi:parallel beta-helix repeat protein